MRIAASVVIGVPLGAIGLSVLTYLFHWVFFRPALGDGQYALVFIFTLTVGAILGVLTGMAIAFLSRGETVEAGRVAFNGGLIMAVLLFLVGWFLLSGTQHPTPAERLVSTIFWCAVPVLWSALLIRSGLCLKQDDPYGG